MYALRDAGTDQPDAARCDAFLAKLNEDLNFPQALAVMWETLKADLAPAVKRATLLWFDQALGLQLAAWQPKAQAVPAGAQALADARWAAKQAKDWALADQLRQQLLASGWEMKDGKDGFTLNAVAAVRGG